MERRYCTYSALPRPAIAITRSSAQCGLSKVWRSTETDMASGGPRRADPRLSALTYFSYHHVSLRQNRVFEWEKRMAGSNAEYWVKLN